MTGPWAPTRAPREACGSTSGMCRRDHERAVVVVAAETRQRHWSLGGKTVRYTIVPAFGKLVVVRTTTEGMERFDTADDAEAYIRRITKEQP